MLHVAQVVRVRFSEQELKDLKIEVLTAAAEKYVNAPCDPNIWRWFSGIVAQWVEAVDEAHEAYALSCLQVRQILDKAQVCYYEAIRDGQSEDRARHSAWLSIRLSLVSIFFQYN